MVMSLNPENKFGRKIMSLIQGYNHEKYWKRRSVVVDPGKRNILLKFNISLKN